MSEDTDPNHLIWNFLEKLAPTVQQGVYFILNGYLGGFLQLPFEKRHDIQLIRQKLHEALFEGTGYGRVGAVLSLRAILDFHYAIPRDTAPEIAAKIEESYGNRGLIGKHEERATERWFTLRLEKLTDEAIYQFYRRETTPKEPQIPERTAE